MPSRSRRQPVATDRRLRRSARLADYCPKERWQHSGRTLELTEQAGVLAARATEEHLVDVLVLRGQITQVQREAALKFKLDFHRAMLAAHTTASYNAAHTARDFYAVRERTDFEEAAYQRWRNAMRQLGMLLSGSMISVVCQDQNPTPRDITALQKGLEKLVKWYGLPTK